MKNYNIFFKYTIHFFIILIFLESTFAHNNSQLIQLVGQLIGWLTMLYSFLIIYRYSNNNKIIFYLIFAMLIISKIINILMNISFTNQLYSIFNCILFLICGLFIYNNFKNKLIEAIHFLVILNFLIMTLQILGCEFSLLHVTHGSEDFQYISTIFEKNEDLFEGRLEILRPAGLFYSTVPLNILMISGIIFLYTESINENKCKINIYLCSIILSMSKLLIFSFVVVLISTYFKFKKINPFLISLFYTLATFSILLYLYSILFPAMFNINSSYYTFMTSFSLRGTEILDFLNFQYLTTIFEEYFQSYNSYVTLNLTNGEKLSGLSFILYEFKNSVFNWIYYLLIFIFFLYFLLLIKNFKKNHANILFLLLCILLLFAHNYSGMKLYFFILGFAFTPVLNNKRYNRF